MIGGIDFETIALRRKIARGMQPDDTDRVAIPLAFQQTAAFTGESIARFAFDLRAMCGGKKKRRHGAFGAMRLTRWPSFALKM